MGKFIRISSTMPIEVYPELLFQNTTTGSDAIPNRLNVRVLWTDFGVRVIQGVGYYPSIMKDWDAIKSLAKKEVITLGQETDDLTGVEEEKAKYANKVYDDLSKAYEKNEVFGVKNPFKVEKTSAPKKTTKKDEEVKEENGLI